jgi:two-component system response regulator QseB
MRLLLVEDDALLGEGLAAGLRACDFAVDWFQSGNEAQSAVALTAYDAVVLDLGLPGMDGMALLRHWRSSRQTVPVLVLTARDALEQRIAGLDAGADDYLIKPVALEELAARLRALIRRSQGKADAVWTHGALEFNASARIARWHGLALDLTAKELALLELLVSHPGRILSKPFLQEKLYDWGEDLESNALEVHIHHLRKKTSSDLIRTVRGVGYVLTATATKPGEGAAS